MRANHDFNVNELAVLWESQLMTRPVSQQSWFPPYIRQYGSNNCCLHRFQLFQQLRWSLYSRRPGTTRRFQRSHSQQTTREFGNRNQGRRHRQEGHSCSSRVTKNTGTAQGDCIVGIAIDDQAGVSAVVVPTVHQTVWKQQLLLTPLSLVSTVAVVTVQQTTRDHETLPA